MEGKKLTGYPSIDRPQEQFLFWSAFFLYSKRAGRNISESPQAL